MSVSFIALNRILEDNAARDAALRAELKGKGKVLLSQARLLSDEALLAKLAEFGISLDREGLRKLVGEFISAEAIYREFMEKHRPQTAGQFGLSEDWVWYALTVLWERWFPDIPSFEMFDERMQEGYRLEDQNVVAACDCWLGVWRDFLTLLDRSGVQSIAEFDQKLVGTQFVSNWVQDLDIALNNASVEHPEYHWRRRQWAEEFLQRFREDDLGLVEMVRWALGEETWACGDHALAESLFEAWLKEDPQWGWGWIAWSDLHWFPCHNPKPDYARAEELLRRGLAVPHVRDRGELIIRLADLCKQTSRSKEAAALSKQAAKALKAAKVVPGKHSRAETAIHSGPGGPPVEALVPLSAKARSTHSGPIQLVPRRKVGRNEPCPCGSGKKFKHCCGR